MAKNSGAFVLTPIGPKEGRYEVERVTQMQAGSSHKGEVSKVRIVKGPSPKSKDSIRSIVTTYATGLRKLADS